MINSDLYQDGQRHMRERIADVLRGEYPSLAALVEKFPFHGRDAPALTAIDKAVVDAFTEALATTKELRERALEAECVDADTMNMILRTAAPEAK